MENNFNNIINKVLDHEGGYVDDPKDLGGETKYGITKRFYPHMDIKNLTKEDAKEIYRKDYWIKHKVESIPRNLWYIYFDMCINMGKRTAVKILQKAANSSGHRLEVDGGLGPITIKGLQNVSIDRVRAYRVKYYADIINNKPEQEKFWVGWYRRAIEV
tara:strand:+ start:1608 stop:2084 length:477 start_codon:yes stop_codon:yes gene_type:complete